ncbi:MAG: proline racemase family protein [Marinobacterium sp.]|nr:proline racemase family protein [Marinobacterium sp.]
MTEIARYQVTDMHTAGEPVRIFTGGMPALQGDSLLAKRRHVKAEMDLVRQRLMSEPRGHADMYGVWPTEPHHPDAALAVLFTHNGGYSTMCGHATIAMGRWVLDQQLVEPTPPLTRFGLECPCGLVEVNVETAADGSTGQVSFDSVASFAYALDQTVDVPGLGEVTLDISYGGAYYAILPASRLGMSLLETPLDELTRAARQITDATRQQLTITHPDPEAADLGFLYGTILVDDATSRETTGNLCIFGEGQVDRSPTGSGVTARLALDYARGRVQPGQPRLFRGLSGVPFVGQIRRVEGDRVVVSVSGQGFYSGSSEFVIEQDDALADGLPMAANLRAIWAAAK